jgi:hypothetical protein
MDATANDEPATERPMLAKSYPFYLANRPEQPNADLAVLDKYSGDVATRVALAGPQAIERAIAAAVAAEAPMRAMPPYARQKVLQHCVKRFRERHDELAMALCIEAGKPIRDSEGEVTRLVDTFEVAAEEALRIDGEIVNLEISERAKGYRGFVQRVPVGACSFITPFNFPLNLVAHKVAPAIAAGCPFVLKPAEKTPVGALIIGEVLAETGLPPGAFSVLPCTVETAAPLVADERLRRLEAQVAGRAQEGRPRARRQRGGDRRCGSARPARLRHRAAHLRKLLPVRPELHQGAARLHPRLHLRRSESALRRGDEEAQGRRSEAARRVPRPADRRGGREAP